MINLSIIIPTRNRSVLLAKTLDSILIQTYPRDNFEVIVIDNGSTDSTFDTYKNYSEKFNNFKFLYDERPGLHIGRHIGLKYAKSEILVYADDDIKAFPTWLEGIAETFQDEKTVMVGGKCLPEYETLPPIWLEYLWQNNEYGKYLGYYSVLDFGNETKEISPRFVWGCNFSIRKQILLEANGFHPDSMPKDLIKFRGDGESSISDFVYKKKYKTIYNPKASVYHFVSSKRMTFEYLYERNFAQGISDSYSDIRKNKGVKSYLYRNLKECKFKLKKYINLMLPADDKKTKQVIETGVHDGYNFHQLEVLKDPQLLEWVLKDNYF